MIRYHLTIENVLPILLINNLQDVLMLLQSIFINLVVQKVSTYIISKTKSLNTKENYLNGLI